MPFRYIRRLFLPFALLLTAATATPPAEPLPVPVVVYADGKMEEFLFSGTMIEAVLSEAGVSLASGDLLYHNGLLISPEGPVPDLGPIVLQVLRARTVSINGQNLRTSAADTAGALWEAGLVLRTSDAVIPSPETPLEDALAISYTPSVPLRVQVGDDMLVARTAAQTVGDALQDAGLSLQGLDYSLPGATEPLPDNGLVRIVRVEEDIQLEQESIPFDSLTQPVEDLELDSTQVVQVGQFGLQVSRVRVRYEDGIEISRVTEAEFTAVQPKPRILGYGTKIVVRTMDTPNGPIEYWRAVPAFATSYSPCRLGTDSCGSTTASGLKLEKGVVGVIRSWYNAMVFSRVYVPGYGIGVVADIGGGVSGRNWIDLGYSDDDWKSWAANTTIYFLTPIPPPDQILWVLP